MSNLPWTRKYLPKTSEELQGQNIQVQQIKDFIGTWKSQRKKALLLHGSPGCGKTASIYAVGNELNLEVIEVNASDFRNKDELEQKVGHASRQMSLFMQQKLILVDELDGIAGTKDRGGITALGAIIDKTSFPIVMIANDAWDKKFAILRKRATMIEFNTLAYTSVLAVLKRICEKESITLDEKVLKSLARRAGGDLRGAITDLQTMAATKSFEMNDLDFLGERAQTESMLQALTKILKTKDLSISLDAFKNVNEDLDKTFLWIEENLPLEYKKMSDLNRGFDALSIADVYHGRIRRWQYWRFMVYCYSFLTAGIALAKEEKYPGFTKYQPTSRLLKMWQANQKNAKKKAIAAKIAEKTHTSSRRVVQDTLPYIQIMLKKDKSLKEQFMHEFDLEKDEVAWLVK